MLPYFVVRSSSDSGNGGIQHFAELRTENSVNTKAPKGVEICYFIFFRPFIFSTLFLFVP